MSLEWLSWSNPVSLWWIFLVSISVINISFWVWTRKFYFDRNAPMNKVTKAMIWLSMLYVFVCAFRSVLPRADVQRICLFDTWLSSVFVGRTLATFAELAFVAQWAVALNQVSKIVKSQSVEKISLLLVPMICIAECFSWYAVISTNYLGNTIEESIWGVCYTLISICLLTLFPKFKGAMQYLVGLAAIGSILYVFFMFQVDVPMYFNRWQHDQSTGKNLFGFAEGIHDLWTHWRVTYSIEDWKEEIPWMSLYFSAAVWASLALCYVPLSEERLKNFIRLKKS